LRNYKMNEKVVQCITIIELYIHKFNVSPAPPVLNFPWRDARIYPIDRGDRLLPSTEKLTET
jgi:hypothetical protein